MWRTWWTSARVHGNRNCKRVALVHHRCDGAPPMPVHADPPPAPCGIFRTTPSTAPPRSQRRCRICSECTPAPLRRPGPCRSRWEWASDMWSVLHWSVAVPVMYPDGGQVVSQPLDGGEGDAPAQMWVPTSGSSLQFPFTQASCPLHSSLLAHVWWHPFCAAICWMRSGPTRNRAMEEPRHATALEISRDWANLTALNPKPYIPAAALYLWCSDIYRLLDILSARLHEWIMRSDIYKLLDIMRSAHVIDFWLGILWPERIVRIVWDCRTYLYCSRRIDAASWTIWSMNTCQLTSLHSFRTAISGYGGTFLNSVIMSRALSVPEVSRSDNASSVLLDHGQSYEPRSYSGVVRMSGTVDAEWVQTAGLML